MNLSLSDEQVFLRDAARGALSRFDTLEAARTGLEDAATLPDLWPTAVEAGWPGMLIPEDAGGAGLAPFDAMLVAEEIGRALAGVPFLGVLPATILLAAGGDDRLAAVAGGQTRVAYVPARPPGDLDEPEWTTDVAGGGRGPAFQASGTEGALALSGRAAYVPDAHGAELLVVIAVDAHGAPIAAVVEAGAEGVAIEHVQRYDATRSLAHVTLAEAPARPLSCSIEDMARAWHLAQALIAAEAVGTATAAHEMMLAYAKERFTFGRAIGSYQAVKHEIVEVLRQLENARSLLFYAGWAGERRPEEFALAASAARTSAGGALDTAARANINVHGGIGATWEHDAPLYFRRAQLTRRLIGGHGDASDRVAGELLLVADAAQG